MKKEEIEKDIEELKKTIQKKGEEIEQLKKTVEELTTDIHEKEETETAEELGNMVEEVSDLLESSFNIFGISRKGRETTKKTGGLVGLINSLAGLAEKTESYQKEFDVEGKKGVIDYRISTRPIKSPPAERRRPVGRKKLKKKAESQKEPFTREKVEPIEEREPFVDIFEDEDKVIVMAELPGVPEEDIEWEVVGDILTIKTSTPEKEYTKEIVLPKPVEKNQVESNYRHGILEIKLKKTTEDT